MRINSDYTYGIVVRVESNDIYGSWLITAEHFSSVQFSHSVVSNSLRPHESQHTRPPCASPIPRVHSNSRPSSQWCHLAISFSVVPFSSFPNPSQQESFPMSQLFTWGGQSTGVSALASFLPKNLASVNKKTLLNEDQTWGWGWKDRFTKL